MPVLNDLLRLEFGAAELGLLLNQKKSELISGDMSARSVMLQEAPDLHCVSWSEATLLSSPIGGEEGVSRSITEKVSLLEQIGEHLGTLSSHDALLLLRSSFVIPNILCILHTAPCFLSPELTGFDTLLHRVLCTILNASMEDELAWLEATLPVSCWGIGIRRSVQLAPSAYLASTSGCSELIPQILPSCLKSSSDLHVECALNIWQSIHKHLPPSLPSSRRQCVWDFAVVEAHFEVLVDSTPDMETRVRLLAVAYPESGAWLQALPLSFIGLRMDDDVIRITVRLRLGVAMCNPHVCACCGAQVTSLGTHGLNCRLSKGRHSRHAAINDILKLALESAKFPSHLVCIDQMINVLYSVLFDGNVMAGSGWINNKTCAFL